MDLTLHDGSVVSFTAAELAQTLTRLTNTNQSYCLGTQDTAHVRVGPNLLVMDVGWLVGRKLIEGYAISYDSTFPFGLRFTLGQSHYTLNQALAGAGYVGEATPTLAQVYMGLYAGAALTYLETGQLVKSQGAFQGEAAELKSLAAGNGITLTEGADAITIDGASTLTATPPLSITGGVVSVDLSAYATASGLSQATADIAANAGDIAANTTSLATKASTTYVNTQLATKQDTLATGNPSDPSHVKLLENNGVKVVIATNGLTASNQTSYVEISGATLQTSIAGKQDALATGNPSDPSHVKLLENNGVKAVIATNGLTASNQTSYVELSGATLQTSIATKADQSDLTPIQAVVQNTGNGYYYLRTPTTSSLIVSNGANTGSVAAFNYDGSSVLHGNTTILGTITNTGLASDLAGKQASLSAGNDVTLDVGRGDVYLEDSSYDNADGAGVTLRTTDNPSNSGGSIFAVRSLANASRLWVGQDLTSTGANAFYCGFTGVAGEEATASNYAHSFSDSAVTLGTATTVDGQLTAASIAGGALTQIQSEITTAVATKQDTLNDNGGSGLPPVDGTTVRRIFGQSPMSVAGYLDLANPNNPDNGNIRVSWNVLWDAGQLTNQITGNQNSNYSTSQSRNVTTHGVTFSTAFSAAPIVFTNMTGNASGHASIDYIWTSNVTTSGCNIIVSDRSGSGGVTLNWFAVQANTMQ